MTRDILFSFDTTGSMYPCLGQVRNNLASLIPKLLAIPGVRIGIIAHGDYCDERTSYITKMLDFTTNEKDIVHFVKNVGPTGGGDADECYEFVLNQARFASWNTGTSKSLIMIGDANPHAPNYPLNHKKLDWRNEAGLLKESGIKIYSVQALSRFSSSSFWGEIAKMTGGYHLKLDQFSDIYHLILAVGYHQVSNDELQTYEKSLIVNGQMNRNVDQFIGTMLGRTTSTAYVPTPTSLEAVSPGRFQVMTVPKDIAIKQFVLDNGIEFKVGRGFYEFTKRVEVSAKKEIVLMDKHTGDMYTGTKAREIAKIPVGVTANVSPSDVAGYTVFIQSTSYNRVLKAGTKFLYEVPDYEG